MEKQLNKNKGSLIEDTENKSMILCLIITILDKENIIKLPLTQKLYTKENLFESLCNKVSMISKNYERRIYKLENDNKNLEMKLNYLLQPFNFTMMTTNSNYNAFQINPNTNMSIRQRQIQYVRQTP